MTDEQQIAALRGDMPGGGPRRPPRTESVHHQGGGEDADVDVPTVRVRGLTD
jgi:hypothetical protein